MIYNQFDTDKSRFKKLRFKKESRFKKLRFKKESRFKKDCSNNQNFSTQIAWFKKD